MCRKGRGMRTVILSRTLNEFRNWLGKYVDVKKTQQVGVKISAKNLVPLPGPHHWYLPLPARHTNLSNSLTSARRGSNSWTIHSFLKGTIPR